MIEVGKYVVAIVDHSKGSYKKGDIFPCFGIRISFCKCDTHIINIGRKCPPGYIICKECGSEVYDKTNYNWYFISSFRALDDITPPIEQIIKEIAPLELTT